MIYINPASEKHIANLKIHLPQSLLLAGDVGTGLLTVARYIAADALAFVLSPRNSKDETDASGTISVEKIRELYEQTRAKRTSRHIIIIDNAERMSAGAQAAFLKLLEEPNANTHFILTSHAPERLLTTIRSRAQQFMLSAITQDQTEAFISSLDQHDKTRLEQMRFIAEGLPAELHRLANDEGYFNKRIAIMTDARHLLQTSPYERILLIGRYQGDRDAALRLVEGMLLIVRRSLSKKPQPNMIKQLEKLLDIAAKVEANHSVRLQLSRCAL